MDFTMAPANIAILTNVRNFLLETTQNSFDQLQNISRIILSDTPTYNSAVAVIHSEHWFPVNPVSK